MTEEISLNSNSLNSILQDEKKNKPLQNLPATFYELVKEYFKNQKIELKKLKENKNINYVTEKKNISLQKNY